MVASTISTERETTQVRRRKRANQCRWVASTISTERETTQVRRRKRANQCR